MAPTPASSPSRILPLLLAFVSGYVDAAVFIAMGGLFVAHVTGNFVLLGATVAGAKVAGHGDSATLQLISFPVFFGGAYLAARLVRWRGERGSTRPLLWATAVLIVAAALPGLSVAGIEAWQAMGFACAMGVLNAAHRLDPGLGPPFTVMTGNVTALAVRAAGAGPQQATGAATGMVLLVTAFATGCATGALAQTSLGLGAMILPGVLLAIWLLFR